LSSKKDFLSPKKLCGQKTDALIKNI